jgi:hypothetical protein
MTLPGFTAEASLGKQTKTYRSHAGLSGVSALGYGTVIPTQAETYYVEENGEFYYEDNGDFLEESEEEYEGEPVYEPDGNEEVEYEEAIPRNVFSMYLQA